MAEKISVLMLGGSGTLSKTIACKACRLGFAVSVLNRGNNNTSLLESITKIKANFYDADEIIRSVDGLKFDIVIDFLSRRKSDVERTFPIFANKCKQYIFISSCCVFRRSSEDFPIVETSPKPNIDWKYNVEKYEAEQSLIQLSNKLSLCNYTIIRPYITYDEHRIPIAVTPNYAYHQTLIERIKHGKPMFVIDDGLAVSTVTFVEDFANGVLGLLGNPKAYNEDFNVVGDFRYTHKKILETLYRKLGMTPNIKAIPRNKIAQYLPNYSEMVLGDRALDAEFDNAKLKAVVPGIRFEYDLDKGLDKVLEFYESHSDGLIDYQYEGQIDRLMGKCSGVKSTFCKYNNKNGVLIYLLFKLVSFKFAARIKKYLHFCC